MTAFLGLEPGETASNHIQPSCSVSVGVSGPKNPSGLDDGASCSQLLHFCVEFALASGMVLHTADHVAAGFGSDDINKRGH